MKLSHRELMTTSNPNLLGQPVAILAVGSGDWLGIGNNPKLFLSKKSLLNLIPLTIVADGISVQCACYLRELQLLRLVCA